MRFCEEHHGAVEYDLFSRTGHELSDAGVSVSYEALASFVQNVPPDSALARDLNPEVAEWATRVKTNAILADLYDAVMALRHDVDSLLSKRHVKSPKPYPRPGQKTKNHIGSGPLPMNELREWFKSKGISIDG